MENNMNKIKECAEFIDFILKKQNVVLTKEEQYFINDLLGTILLFLSDKRVEE